MSDTFRVEQRNLFGGPRADRPAELGGRPQLLPRNPGVVHDLVAVGAHRPDGAGAEHRAHLVLDHAVGGDRDVAEVGQHAAQIGDLDAEFLPYPPGDRIGHRLAGRRVPAAGVRPDAGERLLVQRAAGQQHGAGVVEQIAGERQMQRRGGVVDVGLGRRADRAALVVEQDHQLRGVYGCHVRHSSLRTRRMGSRRRRVRSRAPRLPVPTSPGRVRWR